MASIFLRKGLGDWVEMVAKPAARVVKSACLDKQGRLIPGSPCFKKREYLNNLIRHGKQSKH